MLERSAVLTTDRIVLWSADRTKGPDYLDEMAITIATNYTVTVSEPNTSYSVDVGMVG